jgi:hypothetical protein
MPVKIDFILVFSSAAAFNTVVQRSMGRCTVARRYAF